MKHRIPDYFSDFRCLAGSCPDTCCGLWEIVIDEAAKARYLSLDGDLGERIRAFLQSHRGEDYLALDQGCCPMLTEQGLCRLISEKGEEFLCTTCREHPRFTEIYGGLSETALSLSCPEAARLLLEKQDRLTFVTEYDEALPEPNDLDAELFMLLEASRETAYTLLQNRCRPLSDRLALFLCFAHRLQQNLKRPAVCRALSELYCDFDYQSRQLQRIRRKRKNGTMTLPRQLLRSMEHLTEEFPRLLPDLEITDLSSHETALEQLAVYFVFRWWLKAACDGALWRQAAAAVISVLAVASLGKICGDLSHAAQLFSKEIEHSQHNLQLLRLAMDLPQFNPDQLLKLLEVSHAV